MQPRDVPVIHINTETEIAIGVLVPNGLAYRRPDSDAADDRYRLWEVPGSSHVSKDQPPAHQDDVLTLSLNLAELLGIQPADLPPTGCTHQQSSWTRGRRPGRDRPEPVPVQQRGERRLCGPDRLIGPKQTRRLTPTRSRSRARARRRSCATRSAMPGGVRTPFLDTATYVPTDTVAHVTTFSGFCILYGYSVPFSEATLQSRLSEPRDYVSQVTRASNHLVLQEGLAPAGRARRASAGRALRRALSRVGAETGTLRRRRRSRHCLAGGSGRGDSVGGAEDEERELHAQADLVARGPMPKRSRSRFSR
jgi:hypothetical protein